MCFEQNPFSVVAHLIVQDHLNKSCHPLLPHGSKQVKKKTHVIRAYIRMMGIDKKDTVFQINFKRFLLPTSFSVLLYHVPLVTRVSQSNLCAQFKSFTFCLLGFFFRCASFCVHFYTLLNIQLRCWENYIDSFYFYPNDALFDNLLLSHCENSANAWSWRIYIQIIYNKINGTVVHHFSVQAQLLFNSM